MEDAQTIGDYIFKIQHFHQSEHVLVFQHHLHDQIVSLIELGAHIR